MNEDEINMILDSARWFRDRADFLVEKCKKLKSKKSKLSILSESVAMKKRLAYEQIQIQKIIKNNEE